MATEREKAQAGIHDPTTCPGWYLARTGKLEGCVDCGNDDRDVAMYWAARQFLRSFGHQHAPTDECRGCNGIDIVDPQVPGSSRKRPFQVERSDDCEVFSVDEEAIALALDACAAAGYIVVDGAA